MRNELLWLFAFRACLRFDGPQVGVDPVELADGWPGRAPQPVEGFVTATVDLDACREQRAGWGVFRDRRPEAYGVLGTLGGAKP